MNPNIDLTPSHSLPLLVDEIELTLSTPAIGVSIIDESTVAKCQYCNRGIWTYATLIRYAREKFSLPTILVTRVTCSTCLSIRDNWSSQIALDY